MKYFFPFLVITSQLQKIKIDEKLNRASINELFSREPQIFTQSNGQKSLSGLMSSNNRDVLKWCIDYSKILPPHQRIFRWLMRKIPIRRKSFSQCNTAIQPTFSALKQIELICGRPYYKRVMGMGISVLLMVSHFIHLSIW